MTVSMDRQMIWWDLAERRPLVCVPGFGGHAYALSFSNLYHGRLAIAVGDSTLRVWDRDTPGELYAVTTLFKGLHGLKLTSVAWHPLDDALLAYGTHAGTVGIYDVVKNKVTALPHAHAGAVTTLEFLDPRNFSSAEQADGAGSGWGGPEGPADEARKGGGGGAAVAAETEGGKERVALFSAGERDRGITHLELAGPNPRGKPCEVDFTDKATLRCTAFAWSRGDTCCLAVGCEDGSVALCERAAAGRTTPAMVLRPMERYAVHARKVCAVAWSAEGWLATAAADDRDIQLILRGRGCVRTLSGHTGPVTTLDWSPVLPTLLASGAADRTVQIWEAASGDPVANMRGHDGRVLRVLWSPEDASTIASASEDQTVKIWDLRKQVHRTPPAAAPGGGKRPAAGAPPSLAGPGPEPETPGGEPLLAAPSASKGKSRKVGHGAGSARGDPSGGGEEDPPVHLQQPVQQQQQPVEHSPGRTAPATLLPGASGADALGGLESLLADLGFPEQATVPRFREAPGGNSGRETGTRASASDACLYAPSLSGRVEELVADAAEMHARGSRVDPSMMLQFWRGNFGGALMTAAESGARISDMWLALSPAAGPGMWRRLVERKAVDLEQRKDCHAAAVHWLALHRVEEAVGVYRRGGLLREAVALTLLRLGPSHPLLPALHLEWASRTECSGGAVGAAKSYLAAARLEDAVRVLTAAETDAPLRQLVAALRIAVGTALEGRCATLVALRSASDSFAELAATVLKSDRLAHDRDLGALVAATVVLSGPAGEEQGFRSRQAWRAADAGNLSSLRAAVPARFAGSLIGRVALQIVAATTDNELLWCLHELRSQGADRAALQLASALGSSVPGACLFRDASLARLDGVAAWVAPDSAAQESFAQLLAARANVEVLRQRSRRAGTDGPAQSRTDPGQNAEVNVLAPILPSEVLHLPPVVIASALARAESFVKRFEDETVPVPL